MASNGHLERRVVQYQQLWAPWRLAYIQGDSLPSEGEPLEFLPGADASCFLCQSAVSRQDRPRLVVGRSEHCVLVLNRYPYNNGHVLVSPKRHVARLDQLSDAEHLDLSRQVAATVSLLEETLHPEGFNVGLNLGKVAGAGLPGHIHWHIVPRWNGDTNFMPAIAGVKVIPQALESLWEALTQARRFP